MLIFGRLCYTAYGMKQGSLCVQIYLPTFRLDAIVILSAKVKLRVSKDASIYSHTLKDTHDQQLRRGSCQPSPYCVS